MRHCHLQSGSFPLFNHSVLFHNVSNFSVWTKKKEMLFGVFGCLSRQVRVCCRLCFCNASDHRLQISCDIYGDTADGINYEMHFHGEREIEGGQSQHISHLSAKNWSLPLYFFFLSHIKWTWQSLEIWAWVISNVTDMKRDINNTLCRDLSFRAPFSIC